MAEPKRIVLTGATRGLGLALTEKFAAAGHTVVGCGSSEANVERLRQRFRAPHEFTTVDVANESQVSRWAQRTIATGGPPDLLINNAAIITPNAPLWEVEPADFNRLIDINIKGVFHVLRHFLPAMVARQKGVVVNLSSGWGRSTSAEVAPYCASKYALEGLTLALAQELPAGMAAIPLNPGVINTEMLQSCFADDAHGYPTPEQWSHRAAPYILALGSRDNGQSRTVPG